MRKIFPRPKVHSNKIWKQNIRMCNGMSSKECIFTGKKVLPNSNVQWNVFKGVYFYWEKSTPQFKIELISGEYFFPCGSKVFSGKYYSGSTFFPGNYYSGSNYLRLHRHIQCLHLMIAEVALVLVSSGIQFQPQIILDPDYLTDYLSVSYDYMLLNEYISTW